MKHCSLILFIQKNNHRIHFDWRCWWNNQNTHTHKRTHPGLKMWTSQRIALREFIYIYIGTSHQIWLNVIMCPRPFIRVCVLSFTLFAHFSFTCDVYRHIIIMMRCLLFAWTFISYNSFFLSLSRSLSFSVWWCDETISHSRHAICKIDLVFIADITRKKNAPQAGNTYAAIQYTRVNTFNSQNVTTFRSCVDWSDGMEKKTRCVWWRTWEEWQQSHSISISLSLLHNWWFHLACRTSFT